MDRKQSSKRSVRGLIGVAVLASVMFAAQAFACGIEGTAVHTDGSKVDGTDTVTTSWNSKEAYPKDGYYVLDLGSDACGETVEVYVNGNSIGKYTIPKNGNAKANFVLKGKRPVR